MENSETDTKEIQNCQEPTEECKEKVEQPDEPMDNPIDSPGKETEENGQANIEETTPSDEREENGSEKVIAGKVRKVWKQYVRCILVVCYLDVKVYYNETFQPNQPEICP